MESQVLGVIRKFETAQFTVIVDAILDYDIDLSFDESGELREQLENGELISFTARARVIHNKLGMIADDYLGACIYKDIAEFQDHRQCAAATRKLRAEGSNAVCGSYFSDMIASVCELAREHLRMAHGIRVRYPQNPE